MQLNSRQVYLRHIVVGGEMPAAANAIVIGGGQFTLLESQWDGFTKC